MLLNWLGGDFAKVNGVALAALSVTFANISATLSVVALLLSIIYSSIKIYRALFVPKDHDE